MTYRQFIRSYSRLRRHSYSDAKLKSQELARFGHKWKDKEVNLTESRDKQQPPSLAAEPLDWLRLRHLEQVCIVGLYPHERLEPQQLQLDIELALNLRTAGRLNRLEATIDYAQILRFVRWLLLTARFELIEHAAETIAFALLSLKLPSLAPYEADGARQPERVRLSIRKPKALESQACPEIMIERTKEEVLRQRLLWQHDSEFIARFAETAQVIFSSPSLRLIRHAVPANGCTVLPWFEQPVERYLLNGQGDLMVSGQSLLRKEGMQLLAKQSYRLEQKDATGNSPRYVLELAHRFQSDAVLLASTHSEASSSRG